MSEKEKHKVDLSTSRALEALEKELNEAAPNVVLSKDPKTGKLWFRWERKLDEIEKARIRIVLSRNGLLHIANGGLDASNARGWFRRGSPYRLFGKGLPRERDY